jgi:hypothetical protein
LVRNKLIAGTSSQGAFAAALKVFFLLKRGIFSASADFLLNLCGAPVTILSHIHNRRLHIPGRARQSQESP